MAIVNKTRTMLEDLVKDSSFKWLNRTRSSFDKDLEEMEKSQASAGGMDCLPELSRYAKVVTWRCSKILGISMSQLRENFDKEASDSLRHPSHYARNFLEYCCFKALALSVNVNEYLGDRSFRSLTFDMMVAWEFPTTDVSQASSSTEDATVGVEAFSRIASAVPIIANVIVSDNIFSVLTLSTNHRLQFSVYDKYLIGMERAIKKLKSQSESSHLSSLRSERGEKILELDGTVTTQPVLEHVGISTWPGRLTLTGHALYFEALRVVSYDKAKVYDLSQDLNQVVKPELTGPWGTRLFDKAVFYKSISLEEPVVMEFPELKGHTRRDYWLAIIREILYVHRFIMKFQITGIEREEAVLKAIFGILRVQALKDISSTSTDHICYEDLLMFNVCDQLPGGDLILETLANRSIAKELERNNSPKSSRVVHSISALTMASSLGFVFGSVSSNETGISVGEIAVGEVTPLEKAVKESRTNHKKFVSAQATVDGVKVDGIDTNLAVMKELLSPVTQLGNWLLSLARWEDPLNKWNCNFEIGGANLEMGKSWRTYSVCEAMEFLTNLMAEKPLLPLSILLFFLVWGIEKWFFSLTNWVPLAIALWASFQYASFQRHILEEDLNKKWMQTLLRNSQTTPLEQCGWLNKLLLEIWQNYIGKRLSLRFAHMVERRLKHRKPKIIEKIELQEFSLGSRPPLLGIHGTRWSTSGDQKILHMGFDWDTDDISVLLLAKLEKPLKGTAKIVVNSLHIKGDLQLIPVLDGRAILYSFITAPEVRIGVAFGSGSSQSFPATELPWVSAWLVKVATDLLVKRMVEPRHNCLALPVVNLEKDVVGGVLCVTVISASGILKEKTSSAVTNDNLLESKKVQTFVEVEIEELSRKTDVRTGSCPKWDSKFNMTLHDNTGILKFNLYECNSDSVNCNYLTSCEVKIRYVPDDSTIFWATDGKSAIIRHAEFCGKEVEMVVPFEEVHSGELTVKLVLKEWQFSDGSQTSRISRVVSQQTLSGSSNFPSNTGRKIYVTVIEGKNLPSKDRRGKSGSGTYVKLQYGKALKKTGTVQHTSDPGWDQKFEFDEISGGEYLRIRCFIEERFSDENIGSARVNLEGLVEGSPKDVWIPLEKVNSGELHLRLEAIQVHDHEGSKGSHRDGWIELTLVEAKDLIVADLRGTSDPYVRVHYGNMKRTTKVIYKTLTPQWHQTFEFPDDGSPLMLQVKDRNLILPESSLGDCVIEYQRLPRNQMFEKWVPLQGVKKGEIHIQITRKVHTEKKSRVDSTSSVAKARRDISNQMKQMMMKLESLAEDNDLEGVSTTLRELESLHVTQEDFMVQLEAEQSLLLNKVDELSQEVMNSSSPNGFGRISTFP